MLTNVSRRAARFLNGSALTRPLFMLGAASAMLTPALADPLAPTTIPDGGNVVGGSATITHSGSTLNVNQGSDRAVIDWRSFNIGRDANANFYQPGSKSIAVNRVNGSTDPTQIEGGIHANGQVWILNPNGVFFGKSAHVDAAGIVASTGNIDTGRFMAGDSRLTVTSADHGEVNNAGHITVAEGGLAAFVAPAVRNSGTIDAKVGKVSLAAGTQFTLDLAGDQLVEIGLGAGKAVVDQSGHIVAEGGTVSLSARAATAAVNSLINISGIVSASAVQGDGGKITLAGDNITTTASAAVSADAGANGHGGTITSVANNTGTYGGTFSARGGSVSGDGGRIETSGHDVHIMQGTSVNASATSGKAGTWTVDPGDINIDAAFASTIQNALFGGTSTEVTAANGTTGAGDVTLSASINATATNGADLTISGRHLFATGGSTVNISGAGSSLILNVNKINTLADTTSSGNWVQDALDMIGTVSGGTTVNLAAALYAPNIVISKSNVTLDGSAGARINVNPGSGQVNAVTISGNTDGVTVKGLDIEGEITGSYLNYAFGAGISRGVFAMNGATNFSITGNTIRNVRNGILIDGRNTGSVTGNTIDNTKGAISVQYTDGTGYDKSVAGSGAVAVSITGNHQGPFGNEWGVNYHLNGYWNGVAGDLSHPNANPVTNGIYLAEAPTLAQQQALLANAAANDGWGVQDQAYHSSNRTQVTVGPVSGATITSSDANQGSPRARLATIQAGINAVVAGGRVNILDGTYTILSGGANYLFVNKNGVTLQGQSEAGTIIDATNASTYGIRVWGDDVTLSGFTLKGPTTSGSYGIKVEPVENVVTANDRIHNFTITNVTEMGSYKNGLDLNGVMTASLSHVNISGTTHGTGIAITDSSGVTITNTTTTNNAWGGIALYQHNSAYNQQVDNIVINGSNTINESNGIYAEDESASMNFGAIDLTGAGIVYVAKVHAGTNDDYTFFQKAQQGAIDLAAATGTVQGYAGNGVNGNNHFTVGTTTGAVAMSVNAATTAALTGGTIDILAGVYRGQVVVDNKNLTIMGAGQGATTLEAPDALSLSFMGNGNPYRAVVSIVNGSNVTLSGVKVDGRGVGDANNRLLGIGIHNASASVDHVTITHVRGNPLNGVQAGTGIEAFNDDSVARSVSLTNSIINDFQKNGAAFIGGNLTVTVSNNTITGAGNTGLIAQNGIEFFGVAGTGNGVVTGTISGNTITGVTFNDPNNTNATGILLWRAAGTTVSNNAVTGAGAGATEASIGLYVTDSAGVIATGNTFQNLGYGIYADFDQNGLTVTGGTIHGNNIGVFADPAATSISITGATFTNNAIQFQGTAAEAAATLANNIFDATAINAAGGATIYGDLKTAIDGELANSTLDIAGTFSLTHQLVVDQNVSLVGNATIAAGADFTASGAAGAMILVNSGVTFSLSNAVVTGTGHAVYQALRNQGHTTIDHVDFHDLSGSASGSPYLGVAIESFGGTVAGGAGSDTNGAGGSAASLTVTNSTFENIGREGILVKGTGSTATITGNTYTGKGTGDWLDYGIEVGAGGTATITGNIITGALGVASDGSTSAGIMVTTYYGAGSSATIQNNIVTGNTVAVDVGFDSNDTSVVTAHGNNFSGNGVELESTNATQDFTGNWWGTTSDSAILALMTGADSGAVNFSSFLVSGTDTSGATGFQGDFSKLTVTSLGGGANRIGGALNLIDAGGTINVGAGIYAEALDISKNVDILGAGDGVTIIRPTALLNTHTNHKYDADMKVAVFVHDASSVVLSGLTIDGNNLAGSNAVVFWNNASGSISNATIKNARPFDGLQTGQGLAVDATAGHSVTLSVTNVAFLDWNKNAIDAVTGDGSTVLGAGGNIALTVTGSTFTGRGTTGMIAQNGILLWERAGGSVSATVDNATFSDLGFDDPVNATAAGILVYGSPNGTLTVKNSTFTNVQEYISVVGGSPHEVDATLNNTFDGVTVSAATSLSDLYAIENKLIDALDDTANGLVRLVAGNVYVTAAKGDIQAGVTAASAGNTINIQAGTYTLANELDITKSLTIIGSGIAGTTITSNSTGYGINVTADNVRLSGFTFNAPTAHTSSTYGIKVTPDTNSPTDRQHNFAIDNVAIVGGWRTGLDLNGVVGATIDHVTVTGVQNGNGIALTDSANVTLTNVTTTGNAWGGLALYQTNRFYDQQLTGISVNGTNTFNEDNGVYAEDESASLDMGSLTLAGYNYVVHSPTPLNGTADIFTFFRKTEQDAFDFATDATRNGSHVDLAHAYVEGWNGTGVDSIFDVGHGTNGTALSINAAIAAASSGATINVRSGSYAENVSSAIVLNFNLGNVAVTSFTLGGGTAGSSLNGSLTADSIALNGAVTLTGDLTLDTSAANGTVSTASVNGAHALTIATGTGGATLGTIGAVTALTSLNVSGPVMLNGGTYNAGAIVLGATTLGADTTLDTSVANGGVSVASVDGAHAFTISTGAGHTTLGSSGATTTLASLNVAGAVTLTGGSYRAGSIVLGATTLDGDAALDTSNDGDVSIASVDGAHALTVSAGAGNTTLGAVGATAALTSLSVAGGATLTGGIYRAGSIELGATLLGADTTLDTSAADGTVLVASVDGAHALTISAGTGDTILGATGSTAALTALNITGTSTLIGGTYRAGSITLGGAVILGADTTLDTSAANGTVTTAAVDGPHALTITTGTGVSVLGSIGQTAQLTALTVTGPATLIGTEYAAGTITMGATTLASDATLSADGNISVASADGAHVLSLVTGSGTITLGAVGANTALTGLVVGGPSILTGGTYKAASMAFGGPTTLGADATLTGTVVATTFDGAHALTINGTAFLGSVGSTTALTALAVNGGSIVLNGSIYRAGSITLGGPATLVVDATLDTSAANGSVTTSSINGAHALTISTGAGTATLGSIGAATALTALNITGSSTLNGGTYRAASITLGGAAILGADTTLDTSAANGSVTTSSINGARALTISTGTGNATLGSIGATTALTALNISGTSTLNGGTYRAASITLGGAAILGANTTLDTSAANGSVTTSSINGARALTISTGTGNATLGSIGATTALTALNITGSSTLNGGTYRAGSITLGGPATLGADTTLDTSAANGSVTTGSINGTRALTVSTGTGNATLGSIGATAALTALNVSGTSTLNGGIYRAASITLGGAAILGTDTTLDTSAANGAVTTSSINGAHALTVSTGTGNATLGSVGATTALTALNVTGTSTLNGGTYRAASIILGGAAILGADTTLDTSAANGAISVAKIDGAHGLTVSAGTGNATLGSIGATTALTSLNVSGTSTLGGTYRAGSITLGGAAVLGADTTLDTSAANGAVTMSSINGAHALTVSTGTGNATLGSIGGTTALTALTVSGPAALNGGTYRAASITLGGPATLGADTTLDTSAANGAVTTSSINGAHALTVSTGTGTATLGSVGATTALTALNVTGASTLTGGTYRAGSITLGGASTLGADTTLDTSAANGSVTTSSINGAHALTVSTGTGNATLGSVGATTALTALNVTGISTLNGGTYRAGSITLGGTATLGTNTTLDSSSANGAITTAAINGSTAGGQALTVNAGGGTASLGNLGAGTRLGALTLASNTVLAGGTYRAASFNAAGNLTLTAASTTIDTTVSSSAAGNISVAGAVLGTSNGGQSLTLVAGPGTGNASANGDIALHNVGTAAVRLNNLTVSGDDFSAATVNLAGNFTSVLTGSQAFTSNTLNAGGNVNSTVGGNATGPINAGGTVTLNVGGNITGAITGSAIDLTAGTITGSTITGTQSVDVTAHSVTTTTITGPLVTADVSGLFSGTVNASNTGTINADTINGTFTGGTINLIAGTSVGVNVNATNLGVQSPNGTVSGNWVSLSTDGSGTLIINQEANLSGDGSIGPKQLVVEGFVLPLGTRVSATGELVLPQGLTIGLISPGGPSGKPQLILVHSVYRLGALLAQGYTAIVIDLDPSNDEDKEDLIQVSSL